MDSAQVIELTRCVASHSRLSPSTEPDVRGDIGVIKDVSIELYNDPSNAALWIKRGLMYLDDKLPMYALSDFKQAQRIDSLDRNIQVYIIAAYTDMEDWTSALSDLIMLIGVDALNKNSTLRALFGSMQALKNGVECATSDYMEELIDYVENEGIALFSGLDPTGSLAETSYQLLLPIVKLLIQTETKIKEKRENMESSTLLSSHENSPEEEERISAHKRTVSTMRIDMIASCMRTQCRTASRQAAVDILQKLIVHNPDESPVFSILPNKEKGGYGVFANRRISQGEVVLLERAWVGFSNDVDGRCCAECFRGVDAVCRVSCEGCGESYCSVECRAGAARKYHSALCGTGYKEVERSIVKVGISASSRFIVLLMKLIAMAEAQRVEGNDISTPMDFMLLLALYRPSDRSEHTLGDMTYRTLANISSPLSSAEAYFTEKLGGLYSNNPELDIPCLAQMYTAMQVNAFAVGEGVGLFLVAPFFNHECEPNIDWGDVGEASLEFKASRTIEIGEELCTSYTGQDCCYRDRQMMLWMQYGFECTCSRCERESADLKCE